MWFKLKGGSDIWTDWFSHCCFNSTNSTYSWNQVLINVGNPSTALILARGDDGVYVKTITISTVFGNVSYTFTGGYGDGIWLKNIHGGGCNYVKVNFRSTNYTEYYYNSSCPFSYQLPTAEPAPHPTGPTTTPTAAPTGINPNTKMKSNLFL